jgi:integrase
MSPDREVCGNTSRERQPNPSHLTDKPQFAKTFVDIAVTFEVRNRTAEHASCSDTMRTQGADMAEKLTDRIAKSAAAPVDGKAQRIDYDTEVKGFGLRVTKGGARSFILNYRVHGVERRYTIGSYPDWGVSAAREEAKRLKRLVDQGRDPMGERHDERAAPTVNELVDRYLVEHAPRKRERSRQEDESLIRQWIRPELGNKRVADLRHADIEKLHHKITAHGTPTRANRTAALLSKAFSLAVRWEMRPDNPVKGIERNTEEKRNRYLAGDELRRLTEALAVYPNQGAANAIRLLLLTGARRGEILGATWDQFDLEEGVWTKPAALTKQKKLHRVPVSAPVRQLLAEMRGAADRRAAETNREPSPFLFPAQRRARQGPGHMVEVKGAWRAICKQAGLSGVRVHDLRHTYASILASAGLSLPIVGQLLGHTQPGTTSRYVHLYDDPLRAATERIAAVIAGNGSDKPAAEVIELNRR